MATSFKRWTSEFVQWLRNFFSKPEQQIKIVAEDYNAAAALYRIVDDGIPGCVDLWKIVRKQGRGDLVLILLNLAQLRQDLGMRCSVSRARTDPWQHQLSGQLAHELKAQSGVESSHMVIALWLQDRTRTDPKGRRYRLPVAALVGAWCCELQGGSGSLVGDRYARQIVKVVAYKIFNTIDFKVGTWEEFVGVIPWLEWLEVYAQHYIWKNHVLQPLKRKTSGRKGARSGQEL